MGLYPTDFIQLRWVRTNQGGHALQYRMRPIELSPDGLDIAEECDAWNHRFRAFWSDWQNIPMDPHETIDLVIVSDGGEDGTC